MYTESIETEVRLCMAALETAWNQADLESVMAQYGVSFTCCCLAQRFEYAQYMKELQSLFSKPDRSQLRISIRSIRSIGPAAALVEGDIRETFKDREVNALMTVIYQRSGAHCKLTHAHTSYA